MDASSTLAFSTNKLNEYNMADAGFIADLKYQGMSYDQEYFSIDKQTFEFCKSATEPLFPEPVWNGIQFASGVSLLLVMCLLIIAIGNFLFNILPNTWYRRAYGAWVSPDEAEIEDGEVYIVLDTDSNDWQSAQYRDGKWYTGFIEAEGAWNEPIKVRSVFEFKAPKK